MCSLDQGEARESLAATAKISSGGNVATLIVECARIYQQAELDRIFGKTTTSDDDESFKVDISYIGSNNLTYILSSVSPGDVVCKIGNEEAVNNFKISRGSSAGMACTKKAGEVAVGTFNFELTGVQNANQTRGVSFRADSRKIAEEIEADVQSRVATALTEYNAHLSELQEKLKGSFSEVYIQPVEDQNAYSASSKDAFCAPGFVKLDKYCTPHVGWTLTEEPVAPEGSRCNWIRDVKTPSSRQILTNVILCGKPMN